MHPLLPDLETLPLAKLVAQLMVVRTSGHLFDQQMRYPAWEANSAQLRHYIQDLGVGGVILLGGSGAEVALKTQQMQAWAEVPLLICADIEEGVGQRFGGATWFPPPMALGAIADPATAEQAATEFGAVTAREAKAMGINWILAPVVDINNNPANPVINVRAFSAEVSQVSQLSSAFIRGAQRYSVLTTAKHFPGHGDTATDSHHDLPIIPHDLERLRAVELEPFKRAIAAGVDTVMTAHLRVPALDPDLPATLSKWTLTQGLRQNLGFEGLIVTDALIMESMTQRFGANEVPVMAIAAGADVVMMPVDVEGAIAAICEAVALGKLKRDRIEQSVARIWQAKQKVGFEGTDHLACHAWEDTPTGIQTTDLTTHLAQPDAIALCDTILRQSMQVYQPAISQLNQTSDSPKRNLILVDDGFLVDYLSRHTPAITYPQRLGYQLQWCDRLNPHTAPFSSQNAPTLLQLFIRGNPFRGSLGLVGLAKDWVEYLVETEQLQALILYGSPYALDKLTHTLPATVPWVYTYGQIPQAQALALDALFGQTTGTLAHNPFTT
jgi:beta-glucosidase